MPVRAVLFDLDDTLVPEVSAWSAAFRVACVDLAQRHDVDVSQLEGSVFATARTLWASGPHAAWCDALGLGSPSSLMSEIPGASPELRSLRAWATGYRAEAWTQGLAGAGVRGHTDIEAVSFAFRRAFGAAHRPFDDVAPALEALRGIPLAIVTNGFADLQRSKLARTGLASQFDVVVISSECGVGKPDGRIFDIAVGALGMAPGEALLVGDSPARDIEGAHRAGVPAVWLDREGHRTAPGVPHDRITTLADLPTLLEAYRGS